MDLAFAVRRARAWNPFVCTGTALRPPMLLAAKLMAIYVLIGGDIRTRPAPHVPFVGFYDALGADAWVWPALEALLVAAALALQFNRAVRICSFIVGLVVLISILSSRTFYANSFLLFGVGLLLIGLQDGRRSEWVLRAQVVLIYFGAGLNKLLEPAWRDGGYFEFWTGEQILDLGWYQRLADMLPGLSTAMGWLTMFVELGLAVAFIFPGWTGIAVAAGLVFHLGMIVFTEGAVSWIFLYGMAALYLTLARWPETPIVVHVRRAWEARLLRRLDFSGRFLVKVQSEVHRSREPGVTRFLAHHPGTYFIGALAFFLVRAAF